MVTDRIEREIVIAAPVAKVWSAVTTAEHIGTWFGNAGATIDLRPGGALTCTWHEGDRTNTMHGQVEKVDEPHLFAFRWTSPADTPFSVENSTLVEFNLRGEGDSTRLLVVESGFASLPGTAAEQEAEAADHTQGWLTELDELSAYAAGL